jgi:hypothetical protein
MEQGSSRVFNEFTVNPNALGVRMVGARIKGIRRFVVRGYTRCPFRLFEFPAYKGGKDIYMLFFIFYIRAHNILNPGSS